MKRLYQARDTLEATLLKDHLAARYIEAVIFGEYQVGGAGELPAIHFPEVWVEDDDLSRARTLLDEFLSPAEDQGTWRCPNCDELVEGQFDLCWKCGTSRQ
jgi:hypothetical protein